MSINTSKPPYQQTIKERYGEKEIDYFNIIEDMHARISELEKLSAKKLEYEK